MEIKVVHDLTLEADVYWGYNLKKTIPKIWGSWSWHRACQSASASCRTWLLKEEMWEGCSGECSRWKVQEGCGFICEGQEAHAGEMLLKTRENSAK